MSFQAMAWAYRQRPEASKGVSAQIQHHVLLALANYATSEGDEEAVTFVGCKKLSGEICMDERTVRRATDALEEQGLISSERRRREDGTWSTSTYTLPTGRDARWTSTGRDARWSEGDPPGEVPGPPPGEVPGQEPQARTFNPKPVEPQALAPTSGATLNQRGNALAKIYCEEQPLSNFPAVAGICRKAIKAGYPDAEIAQALLRLAEDQRGVTTDTLRIELEGMPAPRVYDHAAEIVKKAMSE